MSPATGNRGNPAVKENENTTYSEIAILRLASSQPLTDRMHDVLAGLSSGGACVADGVLLELDGGRHGYRKAGPGRRGTGASEREREVDGWLTID